MMILYAIVIWNRRLERRQERDEAEINGLLRGRYVVGGRRALGDG